PRSEAGWQRLAGTVPGAAREAVVFAQRVFTRIAMFTGIVAATGRITRATPLAGSDAGMRIDVDTGSLDCTDVAIGDSIAVSGVCLTVVERAAGVLRFDVSAESLRCTAGFAPSNVVNL